MSEIKISELQLGTPADTDVIPFVDLATNTTKKATKTDLKGDTGTAATADAGTTTTLSAGASATVTNIGTTSDAVFDFGIPQGVQGEDGAKITSVAFSGDNIVFTLDDSSAVTLIDAKIDLKGEDGATGADGAKITSAAFVGDDMVFTLSDSSTVTLSNAKITLKGATGSAGTITSITKTDTTGLVDTYTVAYNDSSTTTFTVTNGADGAGAGDTMSPATNTDNYLPQWNGADSKTLKDGVAIPAGGLAGLTEVGNKIAKTTNITALNETGIADGEIAVFNLTNKDIRTSDKTIVTTLGANDTTIPTSKAVKDVTDAKLPLAGGTMTGDILGAVSYGATGTRITKLWAEDIESTNAPTVGGLKVGYLEVPQNSRSAAYTTVLADSGKHILHPSGDTTARTFTIDSNANVAYPIGTAITFVNQASAGVLTIAITTDTMRLAGAGTTGSRTLAANGVATVLKITSTEWIISGTNLT